MSVCLHAAFALSQVSNTSFLAFHSFPIQIHSMKQFLSILACGAMFATFATTSHAQVNIDQIKMSTGNGNALTMLTSGLAAAHTITIPDPGGNVTMILSGTLAGTQNDQWNRGLPRHGQFHCCADAATGQW